MPRRRGIVHDQNTRDKIQAAALINRLHSVAMGEVEATAQQVNAAKTLLNKVLPDLQSIEAYIDADVGIGRVQIEYVEAPDSQ